MSKCCQLSGFDPGGGGLAPALVVDSAGRRVEFGSDCGEALFHVAGRVGIQGNLYKRVRAGVHQRGWLSLGGGRRIG
ncbi:hypothetical protein GCM10010392_65560 [Streptomyces clavifer]|nr:hypothetical protein GCM10010392_65560 [Streptomyces clavifer]